MTYEMQATGRPGSAVFETIFTLVFNSTILEAEELSPKSQHYRGIDRRTSSGASYFRGGARPSPAAG